MCSRVCMVGVKTNFYSYDIYTRQRMHFAHHSRKANEVKKKSAARDNYSESSVGQRPKHIDHCNERQAKAKVLLIGRQSGPGAARCFPRRAAPSSLLLMVSVSVSVSCTLPAALGTILAASVFTFAERLIFYVVNRDSPRVRLAWRKPLSPSTSK